MKETPDIEFQRVPTVQWVVPGDAWYTVPSTWPIPREGECVTFLHRLPSVTEGSVTRYPQVTRNYRVVKVTHLVDATRSCADPGKNAGYLHVKVELQLDRAM